jgi:peroxiredoxin Q/BCP
VLCSAKATKGRQKHGIEEGDKAPDFTLARDGGGTLSLVRLKGRKVVLYAYPKDDTSGCTLEAIAFNGCARPSRPPAPRSSAISPDPVKSHDKFKTEIRARLPARRRRDAGALQAYGIWVEKSMYGRKYMGVERTTFLIDQQGKIARIWPKVKVAGHAEEVLAAAQAL